MKHVAIPALLGLLVLMPCSGLGQVCPVVPCDPCCDPGHPTFGDCPPGTDCTTCALPSTFGLRPNLCSFPCEGTADCPDTAPWTDVGRAVVLIRNVNGARAGTGVLLNNENHDGTGYVLTANHVAVDINPAGMQFVFDYQGTGCALPLSEPSLERVLCGAILRASGGSGASTPDYAILELLDPIPSEWDVYYAGWSAFEVGAMNPSSIHHPVGTIKKIAVSGTTLVDSGNEWHAYYPPPTGASNSLEGGSSGCPLLDDDLRVIGTLHGPGAADWYKFTKVTYASVRTYLAPGSEAMTIGGYESPAPNVALVAPQNSASIVDQTLVWANPEPWFRYDVEVADDPSFSNVVATASEVSASEWTVVPTLGPGTYHWRVRTIDRGGLASPWATRTFTVVPSAGVLNMPTIAEKSDVTGINTLQGQTPHAVVPVDYNGDGADDLIVSSEDIRLWRNLRLPTQDTAQFFDATSASLPIGLISGRGIAAADYDNDGLVDFFVARGDSQHALLLHNEGNGGGVYTYSDASGVLLFAADLTDSWAGAWADSDNDGILELYVARSKATELSKEAFDVALGESDVLLRAPIVAGGPFLDISSRLASGVPSKTASAVWGDVNGDGHEDIFVAWLATGDPNGIRTWSRLWINSGPPNYTFDDRAGETSPPATFQLGGVAGAKLVDIDADGDRDLVLARMESEGEGNVVLLTNEGLGDLTGSPGSSFGLYSQFPARDLAVQDLDLNGVLDVVASHTSAAFPSFFMGYDIGGGTLQYAERSMSNEARQEMVIDAATIVAATDWNEDGDVDVFLGRAQTGSDFYYANAAAGGSEHWLDVDLRGDGSDVNAMAIGVGVRVTTTGAQGRDQYQWVDGGSGAGGQEPHALKFGLGDAVEADVTILWPGESHVITGVPSGSQVKAKFVAPTVVDASVQGSYTSTGSSSATWTFTWETLAPTTSSCVRFVGRPPAGACGTVPLQERCSSGQGVTSTQKYAGNGRFQQTLTWSGMPCEAPCVYNFEVTSTSIQGTDTSTTHQLSIPICTEVQE